MGDQKQPFSKNKPLEELTNPEHVAEEEEIVSDTEKGLHQDILDERRLDREHKHTLFTVSLYLSAMLYGVGVLFALLSRQVGVSYFIGIMSFMTPATIIISVLIAKIMSAKDSNNSKSDSSAISAIGKVAQEIVKGFSKQ